MRRLAEQALPVRLLPVGRVVRSLHGLYRLATVTVPLANLVCSEPVLARQPDLPARILLLHSAPGTVPAIKTPSRPCAPSPGLALLRRIIPMINRPRWFLNFWKAASVQNHQHACLQNAPPLLHGHHHQYQFYMTSLSNQKILLVDPTHGTPWIQGSAVNVRTLIEMVGNRQ